MPTSGVNNPGDEYGEISPDAPGNANFATQQQILAQATVTSNPPEGEGGPPNDHDDHERAAATRPTAHAGEPQRQGRPRPAAQRRRHADPRGHDRSLLHLPARLGRSADHVSRRDAVLNALVANSVTATATLTVTTSAGASASTSIPVSTVVGKLTKLKVGSSFGEAAGAGAHAAGQQLGQLQALASECLPATGNPKVPGSSSRVGGIHIGETGPTIAGALAGSCFDAVTVGIIQGVGCFTKVDAEHPLPKAEAGLICKHYRFSSLIERLEVKLPPILFESERGGAAHAALDPGELAYDGIYYSTQPVRIDGVEVDPVNGGAVVLARAGLVKTGFLKSDSAYLISSDAAVKVAGIPVSLHVPEYAAAYNQAKGAAECGQKAGEGVSQGHLAATNCQTSVKVPSLAQLGLSRLKNLEFT